MIIINAVLMLFNNYLTAEFLSIAAVSLLDTKLDVYLPTKYGSISAEYGYDLTFRASSI